MIKIIKHTTFLLLLLSVLISTTSLLAEEPRLNPDHPNKYYVKHGDTLWGIAQLFLQNPWAWPEIWHINNQVVNPHLIYPGDEISLVYIDQDNKGGKKPALMVTNRDPGIKTIKLSPEKRVNQITSTIPTIPLAKIESFLNRVRVLEQTVLKDAAYIIAADERHLVMGGGDTMYALGDWTKAQNAYGIYRAGNPYIDPQTKEILGYEARELGLAHYIEAEGEVATFTIIRADSEIRDYDKLLPTENESVDANFYPKSPINDIKGEIIKVLSGVRKIGQYDIVVINRGVREGVEKGDIFGILRRGRIVRDKNAHSQKVQLPDVKSGLLMVFKTHEKVSLALVLNAKSVLSVGDKIANP